MGEGTPITVVIDATAIPSDLGGVGRYLQGVLPELTASDFRFVCVVRASVAERLRLPESMETVQLGAWSDRPILRLLWEQLGLPRLARELGAHAVFSPHYTFPVLTRRARVVTLHDATFFTDPSVHSKVKRVFFRTWSRLAMRRSSAIVVPSQASINEMRTATGITTRAAYVAHHGVDAAVFHPPSRAEVLAFRERMMFDERGWIAFLGTLEPRKNLVNLVQAYVRTFSSDPAAAPALVLAGGAGWDHDLPRAVEQIPSGLRVEMPGYLPLDELPALLGGAHIVAYPSLREGFGLPVLEAMACGACVLTTRRPALPEVGGDAVAYTEVDTDSIAAALRELIDSPATRERYGAAGVRRAASFTWAASAGIHLQAFREAVT